VVWIVVVVPVLIAVVPVFIFHVFIAHEEIVHVELLHEVTMVIVFVMGSITICESAKTHVHVESAMNNQINFLLDIWCLLKD